jgi:hypothetical protein
MKRLGIALAVLLVAAISPAVPQASADLDPPSDVLVFDDVYFPNEPKVCSEIKRGLEQLTADAKRQGYPIKVALVQSETDLGGVPQLMGKPQEYVNFLYTEISRQIEGAAVLAVMPGGFGLAPPKLEAAVLADISVPKDADSNRLARAAIDAIPRLASEGGDKKLKKPSIGSACSSDSDGSSALIFFAPIALILIAGAAIALGRRGPRSAET